LGSSARAASIAIKTVTVKIAITLTKFARRDIRVSFVQITYEMRGVRPECVGAPLIPPNQSLRIKVTRCDAIGDNTNDPSASPATLTTDAVTAWYMATAHQPPIGSYSQFFWQGFGLAFHLETLSALVSDDNWELLSHNTVLLVGILLNNYDFCRNSSAKQRIPLTMTSAVEEPETGAPVESLSI
jgi:hypothetical protein